MAEHRRSRDAAVSSQPRSAPADAPIGFATDSPTSHPRSGAAEAAVDTDEVLDLLGDEYVCDILRALEGTPMPARELARTCDMSRPTVYRRLNRLADAGLVDSRLSVSPDGHHRKEFRLVVTELHLQIDDDGLTGSVPAAPPTPADD